MEKEKHPKPAQPHAPHPATPADSPPACHDEHPTCPVCRLRGVEKKQKWFCPRCHMLLRTCCD